MPGTAVSTESLGYAVLSSYLPTVWIRHIERLNRLMRRHEHYGWEGYLLARNHTDHIFLGDACIIFSSTSQSKIDDAINLATAFKLAVMS